MRPLLHVLGDRMLFRFLQLAGVVLIPLFNRTLGTVKVQLHLLQIQAVAYIT